MANRKRDVGRYGKVRTSIWLEAPVWRALRALASVEGVSTSAYVRAGMNYVLERALKKYPDLMEIAESFEPGTDADGEVADGS